MATVTPAELDRIRAACVENTAAIAESYNLCFQTQSSVRVGEAEAYSAGTATSMLQQPGLLLSFGFDDSAVLVALPASLPLPDWYQTPDKSQTSCLQTLPVEWSLNLFPEDLEALTSTTEQASDLSLAIADCGVQEGTILLKLALGEEAGSPEFFLIGPVARTYAPPAAAEAPATPSSPPPQSRLPEVEQTPASPEEIQRRRDQISRMRQILKLPVPVIVILAEKKIELKQLLELGPGAIVTFEKSCDDLLDLCVNNRPYCRGEAVKIGEKFGLKVNAMSPGIVQIPS